MENTHSISTNLLSLETFQETILHGKLIALSDETKINTKQKYNKYQF